LGETETHLENRTVSLHAYASLLRRNRNFRKLWMAQVISETGDWFYSLAIYSLLLNLTGRASSVAFALVLQVVPQTLTSPIAGVVNDRMRRKLVMIASDLGRAVVVALMLFVRSPSTVWLVYPLLFLESVLWAFFEPGRTAVIPNVTSKEDLILANTLSSTTWSVNLVLGAALGGLSLALIGKDASFVVNAVSFLFSAALIASMHFQEPHATSVAKLRVREIFDYSPVMEGIRYVRSQPQLRPLIVVRAGLLQMGVSWVLFTVMGKQVFPFHWVGVSVQRAAVLGMSTLIGARGVGAILGPVISAGWAGKSQRRLRLGILGGFIAVGIGYSFLGGAGSLAAACAWVILAHSGASVVWVFVTTLLQLNTEDKFRGRVFSAELGASMLSLAAGAWLCGIFLDMGVSPRMLATVTGLLMVFPAGWWAYSLRSWPNSAARQVEAA
jgi:predicted MFS family arabinose efflux permease